MGIIGGKSIPAEWFDLDREVKMRKFMRVRYIRLLVTEYEDDDGQLMTGFDEKEFTVDIPISGDGLADLKAWKMVEAPHEILKTEIVVVQ